MSYVARKKLPEEWCGLRDDILSAKVRATTSRIILRSNVNLIFLCCRLVSPVVSSSTQMASSEEVRPSRVLWTWPLRYQLAYQTSSFYNTGTSLCIRDRSIKQALSI